LVANSLYKAFIDIRIEVVDTELAVPCFAIPFADNGVFHELRLQKLAHKLAAVENIYHLDLQFFNERPEYLIDPRNVHKEDVGGD
jgi:hypothetical protein